MKVFSFCLYNEPNPLYYDGLLENITMIYRHFPDWGVFVYIGEGVPEEFVARLTIVGVQVRHTGCSGPLNMIYRFLAIEEPGVEMMMVRDADSRIHWKDRWAIREFVQSPYLAHSIRDCLVHCIPMLGGTWGIKREANVPIGMCFDHYKTNQVDIIGKDQTFLNLYVWPRVRHSLLVHTSIDYRAEGDVIAPFPFPWTNDVYCGRIESPGYVEPVPLAPVKPLLAFLPRASVKFSLR